MTAENSGAVVPERVDPLLAMDEADELLFDCPSARQRLRVARAAVANVVTELEKAHQIIAIALNALPAGAKRKFCAKVIAAELDGEGITRAKERAAALARLQPEGESDGR